jgi:hypothetical protein
MTHKILILLCFALTFFSACKKDSSAIPPSDYLIFGHFYGECSGERCIEIFKLEKDKLFEDNADNYPNYDAFYEGCFAQRAQQKFDNTKDLLNSFPIELLSETKTVLGGPDASDGGGLYIEYNFNGVRKFWLIDHAKSHVPSAYHNFMDKVSNKIRGLQ